MKITVHFDIDSRLTSKEQRRALRVCGVSWMTCPEGWIVNGYINRKSLPKVLSAINSMNHVKYIGLDRHSVAGDHDFVYGFDTSPVALLRAAIIMSVTLPAAGVVMLGEWAARKTLKLFYGD